MKNATAKTMVSTKGQVILPKAIRDKRKWGRDELRSKRRPKACS